MNKKFFQSVGAVIVGLVFIGASHSTIDVILESVDVLPKGHLNASAGLILFVILYRTVFSFIGCYITAKFSPEKPMKHALIVGLIGTILSIVGAIVTADMNLSPTWYGWSLVIIALPIAWLAGKAFLRVKISAGASL